MPMTLTDLRALPLGTVVLVHGRPAAIDTTSPNVTLLYDDGFRGTLTEDWQAEGVCLAPIGPTPSKVSA